MFLCKDCYRFIICRKYGQVKSDLKCGNFVSIDNTVYKLRLWMKTYIAIITAVIVVVVFLLLK